MTAHDLLIHDEVFAAFPHAEISVLVVDGLDNTGQWPELDTALRATEEEVAAGSWLPREPTDPFIDSWREAYRSFGVKPNRMRPSVDALSRRVTKDAAIPRVSPAVDAYNLVSLRHGLPAGAFDLSTVDGSMVVRHAGEGEVFTGIGGKDEDVLPGEVVYADDAGVLTRAWNYRDCDRTKVTAESTRVLFMLERVSEVVPTEVLTGALAHLRGLLDEHCTVVDDHRINAAAPKATIGVSA